MRENRDANIHPDLQKERDKCTFDPLELTYFLDGGQEKTFEKHARGNYFLFKLLLLNVIRFILTFCLLKHIRVINCFYYSFLYII